MAGAGRPRSSTMALHRHVHDREELLVSLQGARVRAGERALRPSYEVDSTSVGSSKNRVRRKQVARRSGLIVRPANPTVNLNEALQSRRAYADGAHTPAAQLLQQPPPHTSRTIPKLTLGPSADDPRKGREPAARPSKSPSHRGPRSAPAAAPARSLSVEGIPKLHLDLAELNAAGQPSSRTFTSSCPPRRSS